MFWFDFFSDVEKQFNKKAKLNFKINDVTNVEPSNYSTHIVKYPKK